MPSSILNASCYSSCLFSGQDNGKVTKAPHEITLTKKFPRDFQKYTYSEKAITANG